MAFDQVKTSQVASHLLAKCGPDRATSILKLMKLLYLADRTFLHRFGTSITGDRMVSMPHGPVLSQTLDLMNGAGEPIPGGWEARIADRAGHMVSLHPDASAERDDLDELSDMEIRVLDEVWDSFGHMTASQLRNYTHEHCPEWQDPCGSSTPIRAKTLFLALGFDEERAAAMAERLNADERVDRVFAAL
jgi:uncharacterized phage-associated protein